MSKQSSKRRSRPRSNRVAPQVVVRSTGPAGLLRHVPDLVAVDTSDSLVVLLFRRAQGTRSRTRGAMRIDLPRTGDPAALDAWADGVLAPVLRVEGITGVAVIAYTPETFAPSGRPPAAAPVRAVARRAEQLGLEVLNRLCVAADGWGSLDDPDLPRGGRPLAEIAPPAGQRVRPREAPEVPLAEAGPRRVFRERYADWWNRPAGPGGVLHGVRLANDVAPVAGAAFGLGPASRPAMQRYRHGEDTERLLDLVEGMLEPHDPDGDGPCACRALLLALAERQGVENLILLQMGWGRAFGEELWTAVDAPSGRERSLARMVEAIGGGRFRRPDLDRVDAAIGALLETSSYVPVADRAPLDGMLAWLHWASGGSSAAASYATRSLRLQRDRDVPALVLGKVQRGELPAWAFRENPARPDPFEQLVEQARASAS